MADQNDYQDYLDRFHAFRNPLVDGDPLNHEEFVALCERWRNEYDAAWDTYKRLDILAVPPVIQELEWAMII